MNTDNNKNISNESEAKKEGIHQNGSIVDLSNQRISFTNETFKEKMIMLCAMMFYKVIMTLLLVVIVFIAFYFSHKMIIAPIGIAAGIVFLKMYGKVRSP